MTGDSASDYAAEADRAPDPAREAPEAATASAPLALPEARAASRDARACADRRRRGWRLAAAAACALALGEGGL